MTRTSKTLLYISGVMLVAGGAMYLLVGLIVREWRPVVGGALFLGLGASEAWFAWIVGRWQGWKVVLPLFIMLGATLAFCVLMIITVLSQRLH